MIFVYLWIFSWVKFILLLLVSLTGNTSYFLVKDNLHYLENWHIWSSYFTTENGNPHIDNLSLLDILYVYECGSKYVQLFDVSSMMWCQKIWIVDVNYWRLDVWEEGHKDLIVRSLLQWDPLFFCCRDSSWNTHVYIRYHTSFKWMPLVQILAISGVSFQDCLASLTIDLVCRTHSSLGVNSLTYLLVLFSLSVLCCRRTVDLAVVSRESQFRKVCSMSWYDCSGGESCSPDIAMNL